MRRFRAACFCWRRTHAARGHSDKAWRRGAHATPAGPGASGVCAAVLLARAGHSRCFGLWHDGAVHGAGACCARAAYWAQGQKRLGNDNRICVGERGLAHVVFGGDRCGRVPKQADNEVTLANGKTIVLTNTKVITKLSNNSVASVINKAEQQKEQDAQQPGRRRRLGCI